MDIQDAVNKGYYFDRCVDLYFYDDRGELLAFLKNPDRGFKPSITVKGEFIEGGYAISSYISIQNMSYDVDVNAVAFIRCIMKYSGLAEAKEGFEQRDIKDGSEIFFSVLYCDQEKEPPNRAVRFQCTVAAQDRSRFQYRVNVLPSGKLISNLKFKDLPESKKRQGTGGKENIIKAKLIDVLKDIATAQKEMTKAQLENSAMNPITKSMQRKALEINSIVCDTTCAETEVKLTPKEYTVGELLRVLNCYATDSDGTKSYCRWVIAINGNTLNVTRIVPPNWRAVAITEGNVTEEQQKNYYEKNFVKNEYIVYIGENWSQKSSWQGRGSVIYLNYVKSAYRTENVIHCSTIYDDRIRPGTFCVIQGNAIMGRHSGRGTKSGSRLIHLTNQLVLFRVTGGLNFEFSTTEGSSMSMTGYIVNEDYKPSDNQGETKNNNEISMSIQR